jgi:hypothetical protein
VARFTGHNTAELMDLVHAGILEQVAGRRACQLTATSLRAWMASRDPDGASVTAESAPPATAARPAADGTVVALPSSSSLRETRTRR